jgi:NADH-quinone oxidoreductase subunit M
LCGFWGEALVTLAAWPNHWWMAVVAAGVVILTAAYILWTIQRVYLGPEYRGPSAERLTPLERREFAILAPLVALSIALGVCPQLLFRYVTPTIDRQIKALVAAPHPAEMASGARGLAPDGPLPAVAPANTIAP